MADTTAEGIDRRAFLKGSGALMLSMSQLGWALGDASVSLADPLPGDDVIYEGFEELYREKWSWDKIAKGTHFVNCWYQRNCSWNVYVRNGIVWR